jgi:YHS domain-containing protein
MHGLSRRSAIRGPILLFGSLGSLAALSHSTGAESVPLAIKGYDPVAYFADGTPTPGLPEVEYEWDEHRYRFSRPEHRELFKADPVRYAPQFANFCAMALAKGKLVEADPESWLISEGKLYIFGKREGPELFRQNPAGNIAKANENRPLIPRH